MGIKKAFEKLQKKIVVRKEREKAVRKAESESLHKARLKEAVILGRQRATMEREARVKRLKGGRGGGTIDRLARRINIAAENLGYAHPKVAKPKTTKKAKKKRRKKKTRRRVVYEYY